MKALWFGALAALLALIALTLAWELWLAPLRPGGSWMVLKALPLLLPLRGMLHGRRRSFQWACFLSLAYLAEGVVRAWSEAAVRPLAFLEIALAIALFLTCAYYARGAGQAARAARPA